MRSMTAGADWLNSVMEDVAHLPLRRLRRHLPLAEEDYPGTPRLAVNPSFSIYGFRRFR
jgi:hypothetical protein